MPVVFRQGQPTLRQLRLIRDEGEPRHLPATRGDCEGGPRPCAYLSCRHHLATEVTFAGALRLHWDPELEPDRPTCSLDAAALGGLSGEEVGTLMGCTRERIRQIEEQVFARLADWAEEQMKP